MASKVGCKKLVRSKSGLKIVADADNNRSPFELCEPPWIPDVESPECMQCQAKFDFLKRRHHCRRCGRIYCSSCCESKLPLTRMCFIDPVRLCESCSNVTKKENEFYDKHIKVLLNGANFMLSSSSNDCEDSLPFSVKLSCNQRDLLFDGGDNNKHDNICMSNIFSIQVVKSSDEYVGSLTINLQYRDTNYEDQVIKLSASTIPDKKQSIAWLNGIQKAVKMIQESNVSSPPT